MGSYASKTWDEMLEYYKETTPSETTEHDIEDNGNRVGYSLYLSEDPRSPSMDINRTPIQVIDVKQKQQNYDNSGIAVTDIMFDDMAIDSDKWSSHITKLNQLLDPRSPTVGVERTPIDLRTNQSINVEMPAMRLSFSSHAGDSSSQSLDSISIKDNCISTTPLPEDKVLKTDDGNKSSQQKRVRTPLASVQKQTPVSRNVRQRKSLTIEKRAHFNSHLLKNKLRAENNENLISAQVSDDKENV